MGQQSKEALVLEHLDANIFGDDDHGEMPSPIMVTLDRTLLVGASCLVSSSMIPLAPLPQPQGGHEGRSGAKKKEK